MRLTEEEKDIDAPLERIRTEAARLGYVLVRGDREAIARSARSVLMDDPTSSDPGNWLNPMDSDGIDDLCGELADRILALRGGE